MDPKAALKTDGPGMLDTRIVCKRGPLRCGATAERARPPPFRPPKSEKSSATRNDWFGFHFFTPCRGYARACVWYGTGRVSVLYLPNLGSVADRNLVGGGDVPPKQVHAPAQPPLPLWVGSWQNLGAFLAGSAEVPPATDRPCLAMIDFVLCLGGITARAISLFSVACVHPPCPPPPPTGGEQGGGPLPAPFPAITRTALARLTVIWVGERPPRWGQARVRARAPRLPRGSSTSQAPRR